MPRPAAPALAGREAAGRSKAMASVVILPLLLGAPVPTSAFFIL